MDINPFPSSFIELDFFCLIRTKNEEMCPSYALIGMFYEVYFVLFNCDNII